MSSLPVLIVGAGPTGLMMACELARFNIAFRIIDKKAQATQMTNAAGVQARSMEVFEQLGISEAFLQAGLPCYKLQAYSDGKKQAKIFINHIDSFYQFILLIPQWQTEQILNAHLESLKGKVERSVELIDLQFVDNKALCSLQHADGHLENLEANWIIGCDGYHSTVREKANIKMVGNELNQEFIVADVRVKSDIEPDTVAVFFAKGTLFALFPLRDNLYRMVTNSNQAENKKNFTDDEVKEFIRLHSQGRCEVTEVIWSSPFWIHSKLAETLRRGPAFIAGDAAHVHSPVGAQGMNTGLQDAHNLAWKLALVIQQQANAALLDSYQAERHHIMEKLIELTEKLSLLAITKNSFAFGFRNFILKNIIARSPYIQKKMTTLVSQIAINYEKSPIIEPRTYGHSRPPKPGDRALDLLLENKTRFLSHLNPTNHNLLLFAGNLSDNQTQMLINVYQWVEESLSGIVTTSIISPRSASLPNVILDPDLLIHARYQVTTPSMCLLRPDRYIGLFMGEVNQTLLQAYFKRIGIHLN